MTWTTPAGRLPACLVWKMADRYSMIKGKVKLGRLVHRKNCPTVAFTQVNSQDKGDLADLAETVGTNDNDRHYEICRRCRGSVLGPKSVARTTKLEEQLGKAYAVASSVHKNTKCLLSKRKKILA
ncbi:60S ribosomal protein L7a [Galemys pyrenaicus]|uniref:60S ribosomal protein L7a n=1 Tax=Galemys pyrenaicus TaxID=202257 RepID=A0A8J6AEI8_GALPY|nr:60S ribosomal protein L7a [Galemys pyrenaicus]